MSRRGQAEVRERARDGAGRSGRVGRRGEQVAAEYLRQRGYRVLERNWRSPDAQVPGELDLVLRRRGTLVICEVKARTGGRLAHPAEAVTPAKAARLRRLAVVWLNEGDRRGGRVRKGSRPAARRLAPSRVAERSERAGVAALVGRVAASRAAVSGVASALAWASGLAPGSGGSAGSGAGARSGYRRVGAEAIRIDVVAVYLGAREPFPVLGIDHLIGVA